MVFNYLPRMGSVMANAKWISVLLFLLVAAQISSAQDAIPWGTDLKKAFQQAAAQKKLVLVHFYADSCRPCKALDKNVFPQPEVVEAIARNYVPVKVHVDTTPQIAKHYQVQAWPTDLYLTAAGLEIHRSVTPQQPDAYVSLLDQLAFQSGVGVIQQAKAATADVRRQAAGESFGAVAPPPVVENKRPGEVQNQFVLNRYTGEGVAAAQSSTDSFPQQRPYQPGIANSQSPPAADNNVNQYGPPAQESAGVYGSQPSGVYAGGTGEPQPQETHGAPYGDPHTVQQATPPAWTPKAQGIGRQAPPAHDPSQVAPSSERAVNWQSAGADPADITAPQQPIRNQFVSADQAPPLALEGFCPVSLMESTKWKKGDRQWGAVHRGRTYLFTSQAEQQKFLSDPDRFSPVLSGFDPVIFMERGELVDGKRNFGVVHRNQMFFFADKETRDRFEQAPQAFAAAAYQAMMRSETKLR